MYLYIKGEYMKKCNNCEKKINLGKHIGERRFYDNQWEYYDCGTVEFRPCENWTDVKYTCGDCHSDNEKDFLPVGGSIR